MNTIRIVAAVVDTRHLTMYKEDGETVIIPQGDARLRRILEVATPQLEANRTEDGSSWADVDISEVFENSYSDFQEQSGLVKFFRVAKTKLKELLDMAEKVIIEPVEPQSIGVVPVPPSPPVATEPATPVVATTAPVAEEDAANQAAVVSAMAEPSMHTDLVIDVVVLTEEVQAVAAQLEADDADTVLDDPTLTGTAPPFVNPPPLEPGEDDQAETFEPVEQVPEVKAKQTMSIVDEIIAHATPVTSDKFNEDGLVKQRPMVMGGTTSNDHPDETAKETVIAVVDGKVIPGMELIKSQFARAAKMGSTKGVETFLQRLATVIEQRSHSVEDLLKFMERADLPIADDGSIIIYKVLKRSGDKYVDCHSKKVGQWVGAYVCMDPKLVDHNRSNECSNGLHVARRGYISGFSGDVCVLAKLAPEDVITVPAYDANKMRVCGYHILKELPDKLYSLLKSNRPITEDAEGRTLLAEALCGNHIRKTHEVRITAGYGGGVIVTDIAEDVAPPPVMTPDAPKEAEAIADLHEAADEPVQPSQVAAVAEATLSRKEQAKQLYDAWKSAEGDEVCDAAYAALLAFKKAAKVGWDRLGIPDPTVKVEAPTPKTAFDDKSTKVNKASPVKGKAKVPAKVVKSVPAAPPPKAVVLPDASEGSPRERIAKLMEIGLGSAGVAQKVYDIKKASKKGWDALGVDGRTQSQILKAIGKE